MQMLSHAETEFDASPPQEALDAILFWGRKAQCDRTFMLPLFPSGCCSALLPLPYPRFLTRVFPLLLLPWSLEPWFWAVWGWGLVVNPAKTPRKGRIKHGASKQKSSPLMARASERITHIFVLLLFCCAVQHFAT